MFDFLADFTLNFGLPLTCCIVIFGLVIGGFFLWLFVTCLLDAFSRDPATFHDRELWIWILLLSFFFGFSWLASLIYYFKYKPEFYFWRK
ncbi:MAG: hypothetical protein ACOCXT_02010 [Candidatus Dojkabacteria bacterium]